MKTATRARSGAKASIPRHAQTTSMALFRIVAHAGRTGDTGSSRFSWDSLALPTTNTSSGVVMGLRNIQSAMECRAANLLVNFGYSIRWRDRRTTHLVYQSHHPGPPHLQRVIVFNRLASAK